MSSSRFRNLLPLGDRLRYIAWSLAGKPGTFQCRLKDGGPQISMRPLPNEDFDSAYVVFRVGVYDTDHDPASVRRVVDLGGNVGYSCLLWCWRYPNAHIVTFEPHPEHCELLNWHLRANNYTDRVTVVPAAAGATDRTVSFIDDDIRSRMVIGEIENPRNCPVIEVKTEDLFARVGSEPIDILKMDIEGGEYEIMEDPRFDELAGRCKSIVMEWHKRDPHHHGGEWCADKLRALGFKIRTIPLWIIHADR